MLDTREQITHNERRKNYDNRIFMAKTTSCGTIIIHEKKILLCHVTGKNFWDIPKGGLEALETPIQAAIRECQEETGLNLNDKKMEEIGLHPYNSKKNIHLFIYREENSIELSSLKCTTYFTHHFKKVSLPELDGFKMFSPEESLNNTCKSMTTLLSKVYTDIAFNLS